MKRLFGCFMIAAYLLQGILAAKEVLRSDFFTDLMGIDENTFAHSPALRDSVFDPENDCFVVKGKAYRFGNFAAKSIEELDKELKHQKKIGEGTFNVVEGDYTNWNSSFRDKVDIGALMAANPDAVFQVASNFNCLEPISKHATPEYGVTAYIHDMTQGPLASIAAAPGLIYRMYYPFYEEGASDPETWRQTASRQINLLEGIDFPVVNGYIDLLQREDFPTFFDYRKVKVGIHRDIQLTYGFVTDNDHHRCVEEKDHVVHQIFTAALDLGEVSGNYHYLHRQNYVPIAKQLLRAAYEGVIKAAAVLGKKKVFLTLVGGGVFQNDTAWIAEAIERTVTDIQSYGLEVILIIYRGPLDQKVTAAFKNMVDKTGGSYVTYKQQ